MTTAINAHVQDTYRGRRICVTGGAGFIGSHLVESLVNLGSHVTVLDDMSNGRLDNLAAVRDGINFIEGSLLDAGAMQEALEGAELVFHLAAVTSVPRSVEEPELYYQINTMGTLRLLEAARATQVSRMIYAASSSAYGDQKQSPKVETMRPDPRSPYAAAKCAGEHLMHTYAHCYGLSTISLRYFNIFGPRQRADSPYSAVIPRFAEAMRRGEAITIYGDGMQTRDFTHVANAVHANLLAGAHSGELRGDIVNVACGEGISVLALAKEIARLVNVRDPQFRFAPMRRGEVRDSIASVQWARELLGYEPVISLANGLRDTVERQ